MKDGLGREGIWVCVTGHIFKRNKLRWKGLCPHCGEKLFWLTYCGKVDRVTNCHKCGACLKYLLKVYRVDMKWYCDKCYRKYKLEDKK